MYFKDLVSQRSAAYKKLKLADPCGLYKNGGRNAGLLVFYLKITGSVWRLQVSLLMRLQQCPWVHSWNGDQEWPETAFFPGAIKFGFKANAIIKPDLYFNKAAAGHISYKAGKGKLAINFFDNIRAHSKISSLRVKRTE